MCLIRYNGLHVVVDLESYFALVETRSGKNSRFGPRSRETLSVGSEATPSRIPPLFGSGPSHWHMEPGHREETPVNCNETVCRSLRQAGSGTVGAAARPLKGLQNSDAFRPCAPCAHRLAKALEPCGPGGPARSPCCRLPTGPCRVLHAARPVPRRSPRGACSQLHARRLQSSARRAGGAVWMPAPNA